MPQNRLLRILELLAGQTPVVTPQRLMRQLSVSRATIFRDLQQLTHAGLIERVSDEGYSLGPRIVELDRQVRLHDPLLMAAAELPAELARKTGGTVLVCRNHGYRVMCIQETGGNLSRNPVSYQRGRSMPLYRGATSKIILANLKSAYIDQLIRDDLPTMVAAGLPSTPKAILARLEQWREAGHVITVAEVDKGMTGLAVPLVLGQRVLGSLSVVLPSEVAGATVQSKVISLLKSTARRIEARMSSTS